MRALDRKLVRGLALMKGQVIAISLIVAAGVGVMVMSLTALDALEETKREYYERYRFADVFASAKRAPETLARRIESLPGVLAAETRVTSFSAVEVEGFEDTIAAAILSLPSSGEPVLNQLVLQQGRLVAPGANDEVVLRESFASAHGLGPGDSLTVVIDGKRRTLEIVGIAQSPEFVYALGPGDMTPDEQRFGVLWMSRAALAAATDLDGAFNDVSIALLPGADADAIVDELDRLLEPYGSAGAVLRKDQLSNWFLQNELDQLHTFATVLPAIFLVVAAFLTHMVLSRLITMERGEIGLLRAFGYSNWTVGLHYAKLIVGMTLSGVVLGWLVGVVFGQYNTRNYASLFHFPILVYEPAASIFVVAGLISIGAALLGGLQAVRRAAQLAPAEAMHPPAPLSYRASRLLPRRWLDAIDQSSRIILRQLGRQWLRATMTMTGLSFSTALLVLALSWVDSLDYMVGWIFEVSHREDATLMLDSPRALRASYDALALPGVLRAEPARYVAAEFRVGAARHRGWIQGVMPGSELQQLFDESGRPLVVPPAGLVIGTKLAEKLDVLVGEDIRVEIREERKPVVDLPVVAMVETMIDLPVYMDLRALDRLLGTAPRAGQLNVLLDSSRLAEFKAAVRDVPAITSTAFNAATVENFRETLAESILVFIGMFSGFSVALGVGVAYNSARVALSERGRELASLRVLGFSRGSIAYLLIGELAILALVAQPVGCALGWLLARGMAAASFDNEYYRLPVVIEPSTYATAILVTLGATALSALLVRRRLDRLDLIKVLKTRE